MTDQIEKLKELKQMLDDNLITKEEFAEMKANLLQANSEESKNQSSDQVPKKRTGISWPEVLGVLFGLPGGLVYLFTKQNLGKKLTVLVLSFIVNGIYASVSGTNESLDANIANSNQQPVTEQAQSQTDQITPVGNFADVTNDRALKVNKSEVANSIQANNQFISPIEGKGGQLVIVYMTILNTGNESGNIFWSEFQLYDNQGRIFHELEDFEEIMNINMWAKDQGLDESGDQLFPGGTAETVKVFRVSPDAQDLKLVVNDNYVFEI
jgi:hypothetical protein